MPAQPSIDLPLRLAFPKMLEQWWKPNRTAEQTALLAKFMALPDDVKKQLADGIPADGAIPGHKILAAYQKEYAL